MIPMYTYDLEVGKGRFKKLENTITDKFPRTVLRPSQRTLAEFGRFIARIVEESYKMQLDVRKGNRGGVGYATGALQDSIKARVSRGSGEYVNSRGYLREFKTSVDFLDYGLKLGSGFNSFKSKKDITNWVVSKVRNGSWETWYDYNTGKEMEVKAILSILNRTEYSSTPIYKWYDMDYNTSLKDTIRMRYNTGKQRYRKMFLKDIKNNITKFQKK